MLKSVYMDYAATTPVDKEVWEAMLPYFAVEFGNPSSVYKIGRNSKNAIDKARNQVANAIGSEASEIFFTSCGSESDNWAIKGVMMQNRFNKKRFITSRIEHHAVLHTAAWLEKHGFEVVYLPVDKNGFIDKNDLENSINSDTALVSIMLANNEIGTIERIAEYSEIIHKKGALFHSDAVQAVGSIPVNVHQLGVDLLSLSGHKIYGPKGIGALFVKDRIRIENLIDGGAQERGKRSGTENVPGIVGLGKAIEIANEKLAHSNALICDLRDYMMSCLLQQIERIRINGPLERRLPGNVNVTFFGAEGSTLLMRLDMKGIYASSGSACTAGSLDPSHVLREIGLSDKEAKETVRFSLGRSTTKEEIDYVISSLKEILFEIRRID